MWGTGLDRIRAINFCIDSGWWMVDLGTEDVGSFFYLLPIIIYTCVTYCVAKLNAALYIVTVMKTINSPER